MNFTAPKVKTAWFQEARLGLFIHWGLYSVPGGEWRGKTMEPLGEWIQSYFRIPNAEYGQLARQFDPGGFDAGEWVRRAKRAGMRYVVFTTKHHDGFAMYGSKVDRYNIVEATPFRRDPLAELAQACARHGLRLGLYYSQDLDWHHPDGGDPGPSFPKNLGTMSWGNDWDFPDAAAKKFDRYFEEKALPQVAELLSNYGPIALMWFDCPLSIDRENSDKLMSLVQRLQPECLVNSRVGNGYGDFGSMGDNEVPVSAPEGVWETAATLNDTWGFKHADRNWKTGPDTLAILIALASTGVNYLLNIGPQADGCFPAPSLEVLDFLAGWMERHLSVIQGTSGSPFATPFPWGWLTAKAGDEKSGARLHLIFRDWPRGELRLLGIRNRVLEVLSDDVSARIACSQDTQLGCPVLRLRFPPETPSGPFPVVTLEVEGVLEVDGRILEQEGCIALPANRGQWSHLTLDTGPATKTEGGMHVGAAGEIMVIEDRPSLNGAGIVVNWLSPHDEMQWDFVALEPGRYDIELITSVPFWLTWHGGQRLRLMIDRQTIEAEVTADEIVPAPETRYCRQALSRLGTIDLAEAGAYHASLRPLEIKPGDEVGLALVRLVLRRRT